MNINEGNISEVSENDAPPKTETPRGPSTGQGKKSSKRSKIPQRSSTAGGSGANSSEVKAEPVDNIFPNRPQSSPSRAGPSRKPTTRSASGLSKKSVFTDFFTYRDDDPDDVSENNFFV